MATLTFTRRTTTAIAGLDYVRAADSGFGPNNTAANNTGIFNSLQTSIDPRKKLILPSGLIQIGGTLNYNPAVHIEGQGSNNTRLIPTQAVPVLVSNDNTLDFDAGGLHGIGIGSGTSNEAIATDGIIMGIAAFFQVSDLRIWGVTGTALQAPGSLVGKFEDVEIRYGTAGVKLVNRPNSDFGSEGVITSLPNSLYFDNLSISDLTGRAIEYNTGTSLHIKQLDIEGCGSVNGPSLVYVTGNGLGPIYLGLHIDTLYAERNKGTSFFEFGPSGTGAMHLIQFADIVSFTPGDIGTAIKISSLDNKPNQLTLQAFSSTGCGPIVADGATTKVIFHPDCILPDGRANATNGATYIDLTGTSGSSGGAPNPGNLVGPASVNAGGPGSVMYSPNEYPWKPAPDGSAYYVTEQAGASFGIGQFYGRYIEFDYLARHDMSDFQFKVEEVNIERFSGNNSQPPVVADYTMRTKIIDLGSAGQRANCRFVNIDQGSQCTVLQIRVR